MNPSDIVLHLSLIDGVGPATIAKLKAFVVANSYEWSCLYEMRATDISERCYIPRAMAHIIVAGLADRSLLDRELTLVDKHRINWMTVIDTEYPSLLQHIHVPPAVLYWHGAPIGADQA